MIAIPTERVVTAGATWTLDRLDSSSVVPVIPATTAVTTNSLLSVSTVSCVLEGPLPTSVFTEPISRSGSAMSAETPATPSSTAPAARMVRRVLASSGAGTSRATGAVPGRAEAAVGLS
jgi:hypothetical protein